MCASPHNSPAVQGMMCEQVVAATPGVEEVVFAGDCCLPSCTQRRICVILVWLLSPGSCTQRRVCVTFIGCYRPGRLIRRCSGREHRCCEKDPLLRCDPDISGRSGDKRFWNRYNREFRYSRHRYTETSTLLTMSSSKLDHSRPTASKPNGQASAHSFVIDRIIYAAVGVSQFGGGVPE